MRAGDLSDFITFEARSFNPDGSDVWTPALVNEPAHVERSSELNCRFTIRFRDGITPASHRIIWEGIIWTITNAVHDRRRTQLVIDSDSAGLVETTDLDSSNSEYVNAVPVLRPRQ